MKSSEFIQTKETRKQDKAVWDAANKRGQPKKSKKEVTAADTIKDLKR